MFFPFSTSDQEYQCFIFDRGPIFSSWRARHHTDVHGFGSSAWRCDGDFHKKYRTLIGALSDFLAYARDHSLIKIEYCCIVEWYSIISASPLISNNECIEGIRP